MVLREKEMSIDPTRNLVSPNKISSEKSKFKKFYRYGSIFWSFLIVLTPIGKKILTGFDPESINRKFLEGVFNLLLMD